MHEFNLFKVKFWVKPSPALYYASTVVSFACAMLLAGCSSKNSSSTSQMHIQFPTIAQTQAMQKSALAASASSDSPLVSSSVSSSMAGFDWSLVCYMVNVSAADIPSKTQSTCDIPLGIFQGSVAPGGSLTVDVPVGSARNVDVLVYLRTSASDACPTLTSGFGTLSRTRLVRVGQTTSVDMTQASVNVEVDVSTPANGTNLVTQYALPNTCNPSVPTQGSATSRVSLGHSVVTGGGLTIVGSVSAERAEAVLTGGGMTMHLTRQTN